MESVTNKLDLALLKFIENNKRASKVLLKHFDFETVKKDTAYVFFNQQVKRYKVCISENWIRQFKETEVAAIIEHEVSHALLRHIERKKTRDMQRWNVAADLFINETNPNIRYELKKVFPQAVWLETVKLKEKIEHVSNYTVEQLYDLIEDNGSFSAFDEHLLDSGSGEEQERGMTSAEREVLEGMLQELENVKVGKGEGVADIILTIGQRARENRTLKRILNSLSKTVYKKSDTQSLTYKRRSRRLPQHNFIKGKVKRTLTPYILVGIDTSGSMEEHKQLIQRFISSLKNYNIQYDLSIGDETERLFIPHSSPQKTIEFRGYGGTDLSFIDSRFEKSHYDGVVIFTDGYLPAAPKTPQKKTILVLTENTEASFDGFRIVKMK